MKNKSFVMNNMAVNKQNKSNNSMLNAMPQNENSKKLIGEQSDIIARRHKISGSGNLAGPTINKLGN